MQAAQEIRNALARVAELRQLARQQPDIAHAVRAIKQLQAQRFASSYADLLAHPLYAPSAQFFWMSSTASATTAPVTTSLPGSQAPSSAASLWPWLPLCWRWR